jgi:predicted PurR-regulated permease PerM
MSQTPNHPDAVGNAPAPSSPAPTTPAVDSKTVDIPTAGTPEADASARPPSRPRPRASGALVLLATLAAGFTLWAAQGLLLPVLLAMFFALVGNPIIRLLQRIYVPRFVSALLVLILGLAGTVALGQQLVVPASEWVRQVPSEMRDLAPKLRNLVKPVQEANKAAENIARAAGGENTAKPVQVVRTELNDPYKTLTATPRMIASVLAVVLLTFFFMVYGQSLQRNAIALLPGRQQKRLTVEILQSIEHEISRYVLTISIINALVGLAFAGALYWLGVPLDEALLWGTMAAILNFAPYVGPLIGILIMLLMGFVAFDDIWQSVLPAAIYLGLHTLEGQIVTPIVLGVRMALSPLVLILALMLFGWLWGIVGLLLAVPLLVCTKIVLSKLDGMEGWARLLE